MMECEMDQTVFYMEEKYSQDDIQALSAREHVRMRPALYFEECLAEKSLDKLPLEVLCHALDEFIDGNCKNIDLTLSGNSFTVQYDCGMPLIADRDGITRAELIMTAIFACRHQKKHLAVGDEFCELGMATINYVSAVCELDTVCDGLKGRFVFKEGQLKEKHIEPAAGEPAFTRILMQPDPVIFGDAKLTYAGVNDRISIVMTKLPGLHISLADKSL
jgi:DNA gyrase subunit B